MKSAGFAAGDLEKTDPRLVSEHKRMMILQLMLRYFSTQKSSGNFEQLKQFNIQKWHWERQ